MGEGEFALPPLRLLAQHQDAGLRNGAPLKEEGEGCQGDGWLQRSEKPLGRKAFSFPALPGFCLQGGLLRAARWGGTGLSSSSAVSRREGQCDFLQWLLCLSGGEEVLARLTPVPTGCSPPGSTYADEGTHHKCSRCEFRRWGHRSLCGIVTCIGICPTLGHMCP